MRMMSPEFPRRKGHTDAATAVGWTPSTVFSDRERSGRSGPIRIPPRRREFIALRPPAKRVLRTLASERPARVPSRRP